MTYVKCFELLGPYGLLSDEVGIFFRITFNSVKVVILLQVSIIVSRIKISFTIGSIWFKI